jgi:fused signal recognition particle receptor
VAVEWSDLFVVNEPPGGGAPPSATAEGDEREGVAAIEGTPARGRWIRRLRESLSKTRAALGQEIEAALSGPLDSRAWERLEEALIMADVGASTTAAVVGALETQAREEGLTDAQELSERLIALLAEAMRAPQSRIDLRASPAVIMIVGVNGTGKTTTAGKLAWHLREQLGQSVVLAAADTYRAGASEQLAAWSERAGCEFVAGAQGSDPGSVAFEALARARSVGADVVIVDTAGRLHTRADLMAELEKVRRVLARALVEAPHETLLTLDATTGQNGLRQAREFARAAHVSGVVVTKLDGTARGGIAVAIARELDLPVKLIGVGETLQDLRPFDAEEFARALVAPT